jgi:hypothetical protein
MAVIGSDRKKKIDLHNRRQQQEQEQQGTGV